MKSKGIFGGGSGKIGNIVCCYRYGKYYMRTLPDKVTQPNTPKQLTAREKLKISQSFISKIKQFVKFGFAAYAQNRSAYSAAISHLLNNAINDENSDIKIDYSKVSVSMGTRPAITEVKMSYDNDVLKITWKEAKGSLKKYNSDSLAVLLVDTEEQWYNSFFAKATRADCSVELSTIIPNHCKNIHVYVSLYAQNILSGKIVEKDISPSVYCGAL